MAEGGEGKAVEGADGRHLLAVLGEVVEHDAHHVAVVQRLAHDAAHEVELQDLLLLGRAGAGLKRGLRRWPGGCDGGYNGRGQVGGRRGRWGVRYIVGGGVVQGSELLLKLRADVRQRPARKLRLCMTPALETSACVQTEATSARARDQGTSRIYARMCSKGSGAHQAAR